MHNNAELWFTPRTLIIWSAQFRNFAAARRGNFYVEYKKISTSLIGKSEMAIQIARFCCRVRVAAAAGRLEVEVVIFLEKRLFSLYYLLPWSCLTRPYGRQSEID